MDMTSLMYSSESHNQHGFAHLTVCAQPRPIDFACASVPRVRQSRGCQLNLYVCMHI